MGAAHLSIEQLENGRVRIVAESGIDGGAHTLATADLDPREDGPGLQLELEESRSFGPDGQPRGILRIDHARHLASCEAARGGEPSVRSVAIPEPDRVANVPLNLFFLPLVRGEAERLDFQFFLCGGGPRFVDFEAVRVAAGPRSAQTPIEVRYGPHLGRLLSLLAPRFLPRLSFWFDPAEPHRWLAHHLPLYSEGPEVFVIRDGISPRALANE